MPVSRATLLPLQWPLSPFSTPVAHYSTRAYADAKPAQNGLQGKPIEANSEQSKRQQESEEDPDEPPKKASIRERLRFLTRRYGWWALGVYLLASAVDFSLVFAAIHLLGADHIRELEDRFRDYVGMGKREMEDHEVAVWPVPVTTPVEGSPEQRREGGLMNNQNAAKEALLHQGKSVSEERENGISDKGRSASKPPRSSNIWAEVVLAYTIHKTLLLPFRVGITAAVTPSFVKYMVRMGWARNNAAVHQAASKTKAAREASKAA